MIACCWHYVWSGRVHVWLASSPVLTQHTTHNISTAFFMGLGARSKVPLYVKPEGHGPLKFRWGGKLPGQLRTRWVISILSYVSKCVKLETLSIMLWWINGWKQIKTNKMSPRGHHLQLEWKWKVLMSLSKQPEMSLSGCTLYRILEITNILLCPLHES